jgi:uncharacterized membrane protein
MHKLIGMKTFIYALFLSAAALAQTTYKISEQGGTGCTVAGMNDYSGVAGQCNAVATVWINGAAKTLGRLPNGTYSIAGSINSRGVAVGWGDAGDGRPRAELYRNGAVTDIDPSAANAYAIRITETGAIAGNYLKGFGGCSNWAVAIWAEDVSKPGTFRRTELLPYPGGDGKVRCEFASGANQGVQVVGWVQNSLFGQKGAFWNNDGKHTLALLEPLPGDFTSIAWAVNDFGQAVGESHPPSSSRPVIWGNDAAHTATALPLLAGDDYGVALAVNNQGQAVGTSAYAVPGTWDVGPARYVVWRDGGVFDLQTLLDPASGNGWTITSVAAINDLGQIAGSGLHNGQPATFVLTPMVP